MSFINEQYVSSKLLKCNQLLYTIVSLSLKGTQKHFIERKSWFPVAVWHISLCYQIMEGRRSADICLGIIWLAVLKYLMLLKSNVAFYFTFKSVFTWSVRYMELLKLEVTFKGDWFFTMALAGVSSWICGSYQTF